MALPLEHYVQQVLLENGRAGLIFEAVSRAWNAVSTKYPERSRWQRRSTFRNLVWEEAIRELGSISFSDPGFRVVFHRDTVSFVLEDAVLMRFKHADVSLTTANFPTGEAVDFDDHDVDLYGFKGLQRVNLVYVPNEFETDLLWVGISARSKGSQLWKLELSTAGLAATARLPFLEPEVDPSRIAKIKQHPNVDKKKNNR